MPGIEKFNGDPGKFHDFLSTIENQFWARSDIFGTDHGEDESAGKNVGLYAANVRKRKRAPEPPTSSKFPLGSRQNNKGAPAAKPGRQGRRLAFEHAVEIRSLVQIVTANNVKSYYP
ncbi:hypothetical protein AX774_g3732 [Zancudomyces culisetae]|uniref:Uncharacterized protein n=1 Tax=Zancudomyces culisetae TaxID=1213189 RepID=A0A1R1PPD9_ZANCU|nr:hypothetical protein AX774_g3732 [Zancudomyces culisetae]|eukprot:OMH82763.1 hypothetical protein AX774_g3732 [Zancudomyces culisetae]